MKLTVLDMVQQVLNKMGSDEVNSIGDTVESMQVATELQATYFDMINNIEWPSQYNLVSFNSSLDTAKPTHMEVKADLDHFKWLKYNNGTAAVPEYRDVCYVTPEEFMDIVMNNVNGNSTLTVQDYSGAYLIIKTDQHPRYFTTFDDRHIVFDSYLSSVDDTLQESKVVALGQVIPSFTLSDSFIPDMPAKYFPQLLAEASSACFFYLKQQQDPIDERRQRRQFVRHFNNRNVYLDKTRVAPNYGR